MRLLKAMVVVFLIPGFLTAGETPPEKMIFPGQAQPEISAGIINAYNHALNREYDKAREVCRKLERDFPDNPAGFTGEMTLYQVMMLENEDYEYDAEFREAAEKAVAAGARFAESAPQNDWYYTLLGATWGIQGIYFMRRDEFMSGMYYGVKGLYYMQTAADMNARNWEARLGIGLYLYYRSAYASFIPIEWFDQRAKGIAMVKDSGDNSSYLKEVSNIALFYIYTNEKDFEQAFEYMDALIAGRPDFPIFYQFAGRALMGEGEYGKALEYYRRMQKIDPSLYLPYFKMGECCYYLGRNEEARSFFERFFVVLGDRQSIHRKPAEKYMKKLGAG